MTWSDPLSHYSLLQILYKYRYIFAFTHTHLVDLYIYFTCIYMCIFLHIYVHRCISQCFSYIWLVPMPGTIFCVLHVPYLLRNFPLFHLSTKRKVYTEIARTVPSSSCSSLHLPCLRREMKRGNTQGAHLYFLIFYTKIHQNQQWMQCSSNREST